MVFRRFREGEADLSILLDRPAGPYYPGDPIHVTITFQPQNDLPVRELRAALAAWEVYTSEDSEGYTSKRTVTDQVVAEEVVQVQGIVASGSPVSCQLDWQFPVDAMPPYASNSLACGWSLRAQVDLERRKDVSGNVVIPLVVPPPGARAQAGEYGEVSHPDTAQMHLWLPGLEWVEGEAIAGKLSVLPLESFDAREVQVSLTRREQVQAPRLRTSATQQVSRAKLAGKTRFVPQRATEFPFSLEIPDMGCPSRRTEHTTVTHTLEAALTRRLRANYTVSTEVFVYGGRRP